MKDAISFMSSILFLFLLFDIQSHFHLSQNDWQSIENDYETSGCIDRWQKNRWDALMDIKIRFTNYCCSKKYSSFITNRQSIVIIKWNFLLNDYRSLYVHIYNILFLPILTWHFLFSLLQYVICTISYMMMHVGEERDGWLICNYNLLFSFNWETISCQTNLHVHKQLLLLFLFALSLSMTWTDVTRWHVKKWYGMKGIC